MRWPCAGGVSDLAGLDFCVANPQSQRASAGPDPPPGAAPALAEDRKEQDAGPAVRALGIRPLPLAASTNGRLSQEFAEFLRELAVRWTRATGDTRVSAYWQLRQRLSVSIQRDNGRLLIDAGNHAAMATQRRLAAGAADSSGE